MTDASTDFTLPLLEWVDIPAGSVTLDGEHSARPVPAFKITRYPITNAQFDAFIKSGGYKNPLWWDGLAHPGGAPRASDWKDADAPKLEVCWYEAVGFCRWLAHETGFDVRLPTEWEWQYAAAGDSGAAYPFGSVYDMTRCNTKEGGAGRTNIVTDYSDVSTHFGLVDMSGNVWEWCLNEGVNPDNIQIEGEENRALRGGAWNSTAAQAAVTFRSHRAARTRTFNIGFRVIIEA